jgi:formylglycine-generating enzyme required for sulfatase activity
VDGRGCRRFAGVFAVGKFRSSPSSKPTPASQKSGEAAEGSTFIPTFPSKAPAPGLAPEGMVWIPGGEFSMGSDAASESLCGLPGVMRDGQPIHRVYVDGFWMDATEVTNEQFEKFVKATGYVTVAETKPTKEEFPTAPPENLVAGSTVFAPTPQPVDLRNFYQWWSYVPGADSRHPTGPGSDLKAARNIPWCTSPTKTRRLTRSGRASDCPRRRSGNSPRVAAWPASCMRGAMS